ncbi:hypothetical protein KY327_02250 [Candidatus Woesearchaeota archaeon]|nr:hypothetical protein [Candidatus Woesearchaeota archaeon]
MVQGYCVKCKKKGTEINGAVIHQTPKGGFMAKGACPTCGTTVCAMMSKTNAEAALANGEAKKA